MTDQTRCRVCAKPVRLRADGAVMGHNDDTLRGCPGSRLPPAGDPPCVATCRPVGTIGWPVNPQRDEAHASTVVCDSPSHQDEANAWVYSKTRHEGVFRTFAEARKASQ